MLRIDKRWVCLVCGLATEKRSEDMRRSKGGVILDSLHRDRDLIWYLAVLAVLTVGQNR
jgi:hypothetical protein